jgi:transitional endoplasmic reticulum ATPase
MNDNEQNGKSARRFKEIFDNDQQVPPSGMVAVMMPSGTGNGSPMMVGTPITGDEIKHHEDPNRTDIIVPDGMTYERLIEVALQLHKDSETVTDMSRTYRYRSHDGAVATARVFQKMYGMVVGKVIDRGFFGGVQNPSHITVAISAKETVQVPWGAVTIPSMENTTLYITETRDADYGPVFYLEVSAPKKYKSQIEKIFDAIEEELRTNSIYRGKALMGSTTLEFIDLDSFSTDGVVFSDQVWSNLNAFVWSPITQTDLYRSEGRRLKRSVLLYGPFGTGKTSAGYMTALRAVDNGWTYIAARPGKDKIEDVLRTAMLYGPCVVMVEDIDNQTSGGNAGAMSSTLDAFDGIGSKAAPIVMLMTTNRAGDILKGFLRPGRVDMVIEVAGLDHSGIEQLVRHNITKGRLHAEVDFAAICSAMDGFLPAFAFGAVERAVSYAMARDGGDYRVTTDDLVKAAGSMQEQIRMHEAASEGAQSATLDNAITGVVADAVSDVVNGTRVIDEGCDHSVGTLRFATPSSNGHGGPR